VSEPRLKVWFAKRDRHDWRWGVVFAVAFDEAHAALLLREAGCHGKVCFVKEFSADGVPRLVGLLDLV
jgi:hypothetical protein